jgi:ATP-dependent RNA helicase DDX18/HAS1
LQKNYFLHQSAKDGYRSYLQSYASYSLKKIFDVNALDLAKVGKAFGFSVPPRVNVSIGGGKGGTGKSGKKRARDDDDEEEGPMSEGELDGGDAASGKDVEQVRVRHQARRKEKRKRVEILGQKKVDKEVYRSGKDRQKEQWSR